MSLQVLIVLGIVAFAGFWLGRYLFRSFLRRGPVGCGSCSPKREDELPVHPGDGPDVATGERPPR